AQTKSPSNIQSSPASRSRTSSPPSSNAPMNWRRWQDILWLNHEMKLRIVPVRLEEANNFVAVHHRHHDPVTGHKYSIGLSDQWGTIRVVASLGEPGPASLD